MQEKEEVTLYDFIRVILKRKWVIITGILLCVVAAGVISLRLPTVKVYKASLNLGVGKAGVPKLRTQLWFLKLWLARHFWLESLSG